MAKLIKILAASVGGGLVLGAGIRLCEALASGVSGRRSRISGGKSDEKSNVPLARLERLEEKLERLVESGRLDAARTGGAWHPADSAPDDWQRVVPGIVARMDRQQAEVDALRSKVSSAAGGVEAASEMAGKLRGELRRQLSDELNSRMAAVEERLYTDVETARRETVNAMLESIETRIAPRIGRLESDVGSQATLLHELRDCSTRNEHSIQRLLLALEKMLHSRANTAAEGPNDGPRLAVVAQRGQTESVPERNEGNAGDGGTLRPAIFR